MKNWLRKILDRPTRFTKLLQRICKQDVLIFVNNGNRDALGLVSVYAYLKYIHHLRVKIKSVMFLERFWTILFRPQVTVHISADSPDSLMMYQELHAMGSACVMSLTENFVWTSPIHFVSKYDYKPYLTKILLAGAGMEDVLVSHHKIDPSQVSLVGFPTFDWGISPHKDWFLKKNEFCARHHFSPNTKIIVLASSFSMADIDMREYETKYFHWNLSKEEMAEQVYVSDQMREKTIRYFSELLLRHPDWILLVRKHPVERRRRYDEAWSRNPQVIPVHYDELYDILNICDVLVHWNSTTSVQAWSFGKPTVLLWFEESRRFDELYGEHMDKQFADPKNGNYICHTDKDLERALEHAGGEVPEIQRKAREQFIAQWFYRLDGQSSARAASVLAHVGMEHKNDDVTYDMTTLDLLQGMRTYVPYMFKRCILFCFSLSLPLAQWLARTMGSSYDSFYVERHLWRFEKKLRHSLHSTTL
ncbi:MAG: hypothetical protein KGI50_04540 [Patescibacteria group bacterium]|nr:hypothetical protein [Patescibacteria group bacterium]MDE2438444.1 hypothetical protein [Patescibacteria group bacterium]